MWEWFHRFWPFWRVRQGFTPFPLPYTPSAADIRQWFVEIDPPGTQLNTTLPANGQLNVSLHRILVEAGIALTLSTSAYDPRSWFALYRYGGDFSGTAPTLRLFNGVLNNDPRQAATTSEELATGITCYLLREHFELTHIADAFACLKRGELTYVHSNSESRPDYFCEDMVGETLIAESKGATGTRSKIARRIDPEGWDQVQNVTPVNLPLRNSCNRVVIGTHFCVDGIHPRSETTTLIKDPEGEESQERSPDTDEIIRLSYAKALRFMAHDVAADFLISRRSLTELFPLLPQTDFPLIESFPFMPLGVTPFGDAIGFYAPVGKAILTSNENSLRDPIGSSLRELGSSSSRLNRLPANLGYVLPNGVTVVHNPEELIY